MSTTDHPGMDKALAAARKDLAKVLGRNLEITAQELAMVPGSKDRVLRVTAAASGAPNQTSRVTVDVTGAVIDLGALEASIGRRIFVPAVGAAGAALVRRERVTIDPTVNDLTLAFCQRLPEHITVTIPESGAAPKADVYLLSDTTGSMSPTIEAVQAGIASIVANPALAGFDVAYGVGNYKDFPTDPYAFQHQLAPTTDTALVAGAVATWTADGGADGPEGQLFALHRLATDPAIGWRADARRIVAWFGDFPGHDPVCAAISGEAADITEASATSELQLAAVTVVAISTTTGDPNALDGDPTVFALDYAVCGAPGGLAGQASRLTAATGGTHTVGIDEGTIVATLTALIEAAVTSTGNVSLVPSPGIAGFVESVTPPGGYGPLPGDSEHVLGFDVVWVGTQECTDTDQVVTGTFDVVADGVVVAQKRVRITIAACRYHHAVEFLCGRRRPDDDERCETVVPGRYATAVTIYNPTACTVEIEKRFAPLVRHGEAVGREPRTVPARPFAKITLGPDEATMDDCCSIEEAVGPSGGTITLGVLDIVASHPLEVVAILTSTGPEGGGTAVHTRHVDPRPDH